MKRIYKRYKVGTRYYISKEPAHEYSQESGLPLEVVDASAVPPIKNIPRSFSNIVISWCCARLNVVPCSLAKPQPASKLRIL